MSKREFIARHSLIINKLRKGSATFQEISDYLKFESNFQGYNFDISKRTFQRDLEEIRSLYNIDIQYSYSQKAYFVNWELTNHNSERILEAFDIFNALNVTEKISNYIHFENRKSQGTENLYGILHAIKNTLQIKFKYHSFWKSEEVKCVEPYGLKEFRNRWYIVANDTKSKSIKTFSLDRLSDLEIIKKQFTKNHNFDINSHYKYSFGIMTPNSEKPTEVILSFDVFQGKYIKSLPLHTTQEILKEDETELVVKLKLFITQDFIMEILSYGDCVQVIKPKSLAEHFKTVYKNALKLYN